MQKPQQISAVLAAPIAVHAMIGWGFIDIGRDCCVSVENAKGKPL
jgi:hypothetical protein